MSLRNGVCLMARPGVQAHPPEGKPQRLPVNSNDDAERKERIGEQGTGERTGGDGLVLPAHACHQQQAALVEVLNTRYRLCAAPMKPEAITAAHREKR